MSVPAGSKGGFVKPLIDTGMNVKEFSRNISSIASRYNLSKVKTLGLYINDFCNLSCRHCYYTRPDYLNPDSITAERLIPILRSAINSGVKLFAFVGKEIFIPGEHIGEKTIKTMEFLNEQKSAGYDIMIGAVTNGTLIDRFFHELKKFKIDYIDFSIDGPDPETHEYLRGKNTFYKTIKNMKNAIENSIADKIFVSSTLFSQNLNNLINILDFRCKFDVKFFNITPIVAIKGDHLAISLKDLINFISNLQEKILKLNHDVNVVIDLDSYIVHSSLEYLPEPFDTLTVKIDKLNNLILINEINKSTLSIRISLPDPCSGYACISTEGLYFNKGGCLFMNQNYKKLAFDSALNSNIENIIKNHENLSLSILTSPEINIFSEASDEILNKIEKGKRYELPKIK